MKYKRKSEIIGGTGILSITLSLLVIIFQDLESSIIGNSHTHLFSGILIAIGTILFLIGLATGGFEEKDALVSEGKQ